MDIIASIVCDHEQSDAVYNNDNVPWSMQDIQEMLCVKIKYQVNSQTPKKIISILSSFIVLVINTEFCPAKQNQAVNITFELFSSHKKPVWSASLWGPSQRQQEFKLKCLGDECSRKPTEDEFWRPSTIIVPVFIQVHHHILQRKIVYICKIWNYIYLLLVTE